MCKHFSYRFRRNRKRSDGNFTNIVFVSSFQYPRRKVINKLMLYIKNFKMINKNLLLQSIISANQTIISHIRTTDPIWFSTTWLIIVGVFMLIIFIICRPGHLEQNLNADSPFELSRHQPNFCNTNGSTEIRGEVRHDR